MIRSYKKDCLEGMYSNVFQSDLVGVGIYRGGELCA
jgi:hypothetical protein